MSEPRRKPPVDFREIAPRPEPGHGARVGRVTPIEDGARARLAELMIPAARVRRWAKDSPEFASLERDHPVRELVRAVERLSLSESIVDLVTVAEGATLSEAATNRVLENATPNERARAAIAIVVSRKRS